MSGGGDAQAGRLKGALLDHLEKTLGDNYRKEIDQEENVWRSLPFFAATLAVQAAVLSAVSSDLSGLAGRHLILAWCLLALAGLFNLGVLFLLYRVIRLRPFKYVAAEPALFAYAEKLARADKADEGDALIAFKRLLAGQYAVTTANNREINQARATGRARAGLCLLASLLAILVLIAFILLH